MDDFYRAGTTFLEELFQELVRVGLDLGAHELDHLCFRVKTLEEYRSWKAQLVVDGHELMHEAMIGGRPIASFKLVRPLMGAGREVWVLELPSPKRSSPYETGFEHAEFVVAGDLRKFAARFAGLNWDFEGLSKRHNPELKLELRAGMAIKLHTRSLADLVRDERRG